MQCTLVHLTEVKLTALHSTTMHLAEVHLNAVHFNEVSLTLHYMTISSAQAGAGSGVVVYILRWRLG